MRVYNKKIETSVTMNASFNSAALQLYQMYGFSIQAVWTGTPNGTFKLQCSSDPVTQINTPPVAPTNWSDVATSSQAVSAAGDYTWNVFEVMYNWVRLVYTDASGGSSTAVLTSAVFNGKGP